jgi:hypothetical protein
MEENGEEVQYASSGLPFEPQPLTVDEERALSNGKASSSRSTNQEGWGEALPAIAHPAGPQGLFTSHSLHA